MIARLNVTPHGWIVVGCFVIAAVVLMAQWIISQAMKRTMHISFTDACLALIATALLLWHSGW